MKEKKLEVAYVGNDFYSFMEGVPHAADYMLSDFHLTDIENLSDLKIKKESDDTLSASL